MADTSERMEQYTEPIEQFSGNDIEVIYQPAGLDYLERIFPDKDDLAVNAAMSAVLAIEQSELAISLSRDTSILGKPSLELLQDYLANIRDPQPDSAYELIRGWYGTYFDISDQNLSMWLDALKDKLVDSGPSAYQTIDDRFAAAKQIKSDLAHLLEVTESFLLPYLEDELLENHDPNIELRPFEYSIYWEFCDPARITEKYEKLRAGSGTGFNAQILVRLLEEARIMQIPDSDNIILQPND